LYRLVRTDSALLKFVEESGSWIAAKALAGRYFGDKDTKFVTCFKHEGRWIAAQWVTTSSKLFEVGPRVELGRLGISRRRPRALKLMWRSKWCYATESEPLGISIMVQVISKVWDR
jgi:hypothetical protein